MIRRLVATILGILGITCFVQAQTSVSLAGQWQYALDSMDIGLKEKWHLRSFENTISLPGTLDDAGIGAKPALSADILTREVLLNLTRKHRYIGVCWYRKEIDVPASFGNKTVQLLLERIIWKTSLWIDDQKVGDNEHLSVAQLFNIEKRLGPGKHVIVLRIDNRKQHDISVKDFAHAYTDGTQIIWNGVIGDMKLISRNKINISSLQIFPDINKNEVRAVVKFENKSESKISGKCSFKLFLRNNLVSAINKEINIENGTGHGEFIIPVNKVELWDEFNPALYKLTAILETDSGVDEQTETFGMRQWTNKNSLLQLNNRRVFLRGTLECNIFPLKGHPPMDENEWMKVFTAARSYGLNHLRFHSWCPPEAAFNVADSLGFYLQVELPLWVLTVGKDKPTLDFINLEADAILKEYGNHPSFSFLSMGNELEGDFNWLQQLVKRLKANDNRRLYTTTTFTFQKGHGLWPEATDDFFITQYTKKGWVRGQGIFNDKPPDFSTDYTSAIDSVPVPLITHEIGQYSVYPDMNEIDKYTGVLDPLNFKAIRNDLAKKNMVELSPSFTNASGKHAANLYKEEIERALKTPGISGFQLLDLHDFPGQGTALVGLLDAFWDSKGIISGKDFSKFCGPVVPLLRFEKATYSNQEIFTAKAELANFDSSDIKNASAYWSIGDDKGNILWSGDFAVKSIPVGNNHPLGELNIDLDKIKEAQRLKIKVGILNTSFENHWNIWVYPERRMEAGTKVHFTTSVSEAISYLNEGKTVILNPDTAAIQGVAGRFAPVFWSPVHFPDQPGTMGLLINTSHPALRKFPTENHTDWQWWDLVTHSKAVTIGSLRVRPIVRVMDNFFKNRNMAAIIEGRVGKGKLILCTMDIHTDISKRIVARQLRYSLQQYASAKNFNPVARLTIDNLKKIVR